MNAFSRILALLGLMVIILDYTYRIEILQGIAAAIVFLGGVFIFNSDYRDLVKAKYYVRKRQYLKSTIFIVLLVSTWLCLVFWRGSFIDLNKYSGFSISYCVVSIGFILMTWFGKFIYSLRAYENGIKLPGHGKEIIPWREIENLSVDQNRISFTINSKTHNFNIVKKDLDDLERINSLWKEQKVDQ